MLAPQVAALTVTPGAASRGAGELGEQDHGLVPFEPFAQESREATPRAPCRQPRRDSRRQPAGVGRVERSGHRRTPPTPGSRRARRSPAPPPARPAPLLLRLLPVLMFHKPPGRQRSRGYRHRRRRRRAPRGAGVRRFGSVRRALWPSARVDLHTLWDALKVEARRRADQVWRSASSRSHSAGPSSSRLFSRSRNGRQRAGSPSSPPPPGPAGVGAGEVEVDVDEVLLTGAAATGAHPMPAGPPAHAAVTWRERRWPFQRLEGPRSPGSG